MSISTIQRLNEREFVNNKYYYYYNEDSDEDIFYARIDDNIYRILHINTNRNGMQIVSLIDTNNRKVNVYVNRFKQQHDLI